MTSKMKSYRESLARFNDPKALGELAVAPTSEARRIAVQDPIEALRAVCEAATPGPWRHSRHGSHEVETDPNVLVADCGSIGRAAEDARAIAATHNVMPELLAVVDVLRRAVKAHQAARTQGDLMAVLDALTDGPAALDALVAKIREVLR